MAMMASYINEGKEKAKRYLNLIVPESVSENGLTRMMLIFMLTLKNIVFLLL